MRPIKYLLELETFKIPSPTLVKIEIQDFEMTRAICEIIVKKYKINHRSEHVCMLWETECFIEAALGSGNHIWELHEVSTLACPVFLTETPTCTIRVRSMDITQINLNFTLA